MIPDAALAYKRVDEERAEGAGPDVEVGIVVRLLTLCVAVLLLLAWKT
jgi:hypothetical protein